MPDQPNGAKKRLVKNPETFRERALKAAEASEQPKRRERMSAASRKAVAPITAPVARTSSKLSSHQPFKFLGRVFSLVGRIILPKYLRGSWRELRMVEWPNLKQSRQLTTAVLVFAILFGASIALVDYGLDKVFKQLLLK